MKKKLLILALFTVFSGLLFAAENSNDSGTSFEKTEGKWSDLSYVNVPILKILEGKNAYSIIYQKNQVETKKI